MQIKKKLNRLNKVYIFFFSSVLIINGLFTNSLQASSFNINNLEISEPFTLDFNKKDVVDKGFRLAFSRLMFMITTSGDKKKIEKTPLLKIKTLIDSFTISNEKFIQNEYYAKFDVNFNKKKTLDFLEKKNIFPSIPQKKKLLLIPILIDLDKDKVLLFDNNIFYQNWNMNNEKYFLLEYLLPEGELDDINLIEKNKEFIERYDFKDIIKKYDLNDYIIVIFYKSNDNLRILSKLQLNDNYKIDNHEFKKIDLKNRVELDLVFFDLKIIYENYWKKINQINTSIKLPLTLSINSNEYSKIQILEKTLNNSDLVMNFEVEKFNNENIIFKIIFNGSPKQFLDNMRHNKIVIDTNEQLWSVK